VSLSEDCAAGARPVPKKTCKSSVKQSVQVQCQTKRASPVSNKARKSSVKQSMQVQCETKRASPVSNKACNKVRGLCLTCPRGLSWLLLLLSSCVSATLQACLQVVQVQYQTKHEMRSDAYSSQGAGLAAVGAVVQSMQVQCRTQHVSPVSNKACNKVRGLCLTLPRGLGWLLLLPLCRAWRARVRDSTAESRRHLALLMPVGLTRWKGPSVKGLLPSPGPAR